MRALAVAALAALAAGALFPRSAASATYRVDDSGTLPIESTALLRWRQTAPSPRRDDTLEGATAVAVRLNLSPWIDRNAGLYLVFPQQDSAATRVRWTTQGRLLPGEISPGERVLVYRGPITSPVLEETLTLYIEADGNRLARVQQLDFHFEIDTD
jgi:DNA-dependent RNA polymerase auxiliary subunit epsilon